ncbi:BsuPI-related putative proteinase inhibitor [Paludibaculum fermentans]|uniref:Intracellular proteinase inhibitor BsuPI domain-containing protein n=1 Tax=Paludibaculum fermentans TaxID=1473598 RepID=A0A7S7SN44_PALFE|nr:BsuPI-related putative proteinase inhibitor [Paludibaculum fermentans]QOY89710.1 hypothetical protein IRI77_07090 [Paludibaculum fermentans]
MLFSAAARAQTDYFPLQAGNQWIYRSTAGTFTLQVVESQAAGDKEHFLVRGLPSQPEVLLRKDDAGRILIWDAATKSDRIWLDTTTKEGVETETGVDPCNKSSVITSRQAAYKGPVGQFDNALTVRYTIANCADAGIESDVWLPSVGLLRRTWQTFTGPRPYELVYAKLGGRTVISEPELAFGLSLDRAVYIADLMPPVDPNKAVPLMLVRMTLRNTTKDNLTLNFPSGQVYDLVIRDAGGKQIYQWSANKTFVAVLHSETVKGEANWVVSLPLGEQTGAANQPWPDGRYTAEAWLTTDGGKLYGGTVAFEIMAVH